MRWWCHIWEHYLVTRGSWGDQMWHQQHQTEQYFHSPSPAWPVSLHSWWGTPGEDDIKLRMFSLIISIVVGPTFWWSDRQCDGEQSYCFQHRWRLSCFLQCEDWVYFWQSNKVKIWNLLYLLYKFDFFSDSFARGILLFRSNATKLGHNSVTRCQILYKESNDLLQFLYGIFNITRNILSVIFHSEHPPTTTTTT